MGAWQAAPLLELAMLSPPPVCFQADQVGHAGQLSSAIPLPGDLNRPAEIAVFARSS
ncbi:hypothetical protein [Desulfogranum mediterraneum]|uniref:hypothetical protein n=1 Tax=Desulfogranum mediterraneum TaxID=160661 RepID=UPI0004055A79|nr:hypothetical protein [Desulfogranum mediterraneum]